MKSYRIIYQYGDLRSVWSTDQILEYSPNRNSAYIKFVERQTRKTVTLFAASGLVIVEEL